MDDAARDRELGMHRRITRRDFLDGTAVAIGAAVLSGRTAAGQTATVPQSDPRYYPPAISGLRGNHAGSFEVAHAMRDGKTWADAKALNEHYDLVVVGGGISGLSTAYLFRKFFGPDAKILILDNHDDFGGHAKRNEFRIGNRMLLCFGGTQSIEALGSYYQVSYDFLKEIGIEIKRFENYYDSDFDRKWGLRRAVFFDKETFGADKLVFSMPGGGRGGRGGGGAPDESAWREFLAQTPFSEKARADMLRLMTVKVDYLPGLSAAEKRDRLAKISYRTFLTEHAKVDPQVIEYFQNQGNGGMAMGPDAMAATRYLPEAAREGMGLAEGGRGGGRGGRGNGVIPPEEMPSVPCHFPDGNASIARMLVRSLIPGSAEGRTMEDIVTARMNYSRLDLPANRVRLRLNSTVVRARNVGDPASAKEVEVHYVLRGQAYQVRADRCVLACWNMVIPYLCPEMSGKQKEALKYCVKAPLVYANALLRNWQALKKVGVSGITYPGGYFPNVGMDFPVSMGGYQFTGSPDEPCVLRMVRVPLKPGIPIKDQFRAGRAELQTTPFSAFERAIRDQLARALRDGGFDPARDIQAITVNRWPHGYAWEYAALGEPDWAPDEKPCIVGRQPFGRISIANADSGGLAETNEAIAQAHRAAQEVAGRQARG
jgi:spermidine dehydrogenase